MGIGFSQYRWLGQTERRAGEKSRISSAGFADFIHHGGLTWVYNQINTEIFTASYRKVFQHLQNQIRNARTFHSLGSFGFHKLPKTGKKNVKEGCIL